MKNSVVVRAHVAALVLVLAACSQAAPNGTPGSYLPSIAAHSLRPHATFKTLYSFGATGSDGTEPVAPLADLNGTLYGTTYGGGANGDGTGFSVTTTGTEHVLHSFGAASDASHPRGGLVAVGTTLYGAAPQGGASGYGAAYSLTTTGSENVFHSFSYNQSDGYAPWAGPIYLNGALYGTTDNGGTLNGGTVYSILGGVEKVVHSFGGANGEYLIGGLTEIGGVLYGTSAAGGANGAGTVFSLTTSGTEKVLHSFNKTGDGYQPETDLVDLNGTLYGTTESGGTYKRGIVFAITTTGTYKVLHEFGAIAHDGSYPLSGLVAVNGVLYGTTDEGGTYNRGTLFSITTTGTETVLHDFAGADGQNPRADMIDVNGTLYGTTFEGGSHFKGSVFSYVP